MIASMFHKIVMMTLFARAKNELVLGSQMVKFEAWAKEEISHDNRGILQEYYLDEFRPRENYIAIAFDFEDAYSGKDAWTTMDLDLDGNIL